MVRPPSSVERLLSELTTRYGSVESMFSVVDRLRADPAATNTVLPSAQPPHRRRRAYDPGPVTQGAARPLRRRPGAQRRRIWRYARP
ncbi:hypothetical protein [Nocardia violaceofusca]|uniref:hypothetical protein n=1 Tax=Nocardia violaceofusca TaxID=941182 RepID=UPI0007A3FE96|nr:hypothetical protein [Nocardia violaceofusca]